MLDFIEEYEWMSIYTVPLFIVGISGFLLGVFTKVMHTKVFRWLGVDISCYQKDIMDIKKTSLQIAEEWIEMNKLIKETQDYQATFVDHFQSEFQAKCEALGYNISACLEKEILTNEDMFTRLKQTIETMQEDIFAIKQFLQLLVDQSHTVDGKKALVNSAAQTDFEIRKRVRNTKILNSKSKVNSDLEASKFIASMKTCMTDIIKNAKLQLSLDREEDSKELEIIFSKLAEDREDIKKTIVHAFSAATERAKKNYDQFSHVGQEAMHYIAVLNENTNNMLKTKLDDADGRLKGILSAVRGQTSDVTLIREILENVDGQFDEIFKRIELGCQKDTEHCEEMAQRLETASKNWVITASELENFAKEFSNDAKNMKEILKEMKNLRDSADQNDIIHKTFKNNKGKSEIIQHDSVKNSTTDDLQAFSQKQVCLNFMNSVIESCWEKLSCMNNRVEIGCGEICEIMDILKWKLLSLNESVTKLDDVLRNIDMENLVRHMSYTKCHHENSEEILETLVSTNFGDAGDAQPQIFQQTTDSLTNETTAQKIQPIAINKEMKLIELILRKVYKKRFFCQENDEIVSLNSIQETSDNSEWSQDSTTDVIEQKSDDALVLKLNETGTNQLDDERKVKLKD